MLHDDTQHRMTVQSRIPSAAAGAREVTGGGGKAQLSWG
jgi:hypothetical protein